MTFAKQGDRVRAHFTGKLADGSVFDTTRERDPLVVEIGSGRALPRFEQMLVGMSPGESRNFVIPAADAYGPRRAELVMEVPRSQFPSDQEPQIGQTLRLSRDGGVAQPALVLEVAATSLTVDTNHPLAGKDLEFEVELMEVLEDA